MVMINVAILLGLSYTPLLSVKGPAQTSSKCMNGHTSLVAVCSASSYATLQKQMPRKCASTVSSSIDLQSSYAFSNRLFATLNSLRPYRLYLQ